MPIVKKSISLILCIALVFIMFPSLAFGAGVAARASGASTAARVTASKAISKPVTKSPVQIRTNLIQTKGFQ